MKWEIFVTVTSLDNDELFMTKSLQFIDKINFKIDMKVNNKNDMTMKLQR